MASASLSIQPYQAKPMFAEMAPFLSQVLADPAVAPQLPSSAHALLDTLREKNVQELKKLDDKLEDAEKNLGEMEISDALRARASYLAKIGENVRSAIGIDKSRVATDFCVHQEKALAAYETAFKKQAGLGSKIDLRLAAIRVGFFHGDHKTITSYIEKAKECASPLTQLNLAPAA
jgi:26S proteasome regulatory subunit N7